MSTYEARLSALREQLRKDRLDGFVVPLTDEHMSEYVGAYAQRLAWLTGFQGSAGSAVVLPEEAAIFVDGRYTLQVREQVDGNLWQYESVPQTSVASWLGDHAADGGRIGYDPWPDRPEPSKAHLVVHDDSYAGKSARDKRQDMADWLSARKADSVVLSALDSIAWTFNIRGADVDRTPVALAYALVHADATADLYVAPEKISDAVIQHLGNAVRVHDRADFADALTALSGKTVIADPERAVAAIFDTLEQGGAKVVAQRDPAVLAKAIKNDAEITGHRAAQHRDGAALSRYLHWLSVEAPKGGLTEMSAAERLQGFREDTGKLKDLSFDTISAFGPNGASPHYKVEDASSLPITAGSLYLVDSGGQYLDGTTDVTRTIAIGTPTDEMRNRFTLVLKGHIALASAVFPTGTRGGQLDVLARQYLWAKGLDYAHGTGHGVGSFLSVHEGPQRIATFGGGDEPLRAGMILSNEPGYYKAGEYGIRIENLVLVETRDVPGAEQAMLGFETLTFAPIDRALVDVSIMTAQERDWLNAYHAKVLAIVGPQLEGDALTWLNGACAPL